MKSWKISGQAKSEIVELNTERAKDEIKVKVTKVILSPSDISLFKGGALSTPIVPGRVAIGLISDVGEDQGYKIGQKVLITPYTKKDEFRDCKGDKDEEDGDLTIYGLNSDGFLSNYAIAASNCITEIPDDVAEEDILLSEYIAIAITVTEKLEIKQGDFVAVFGSSFLSYVLCQLCIYYHAIPIMISSDEKGVEFAKAHGVYYTVDSEKENAREKIYQITSGNLANVAAFDCDTPSIPSDICELIKNKSKICFFGFGANSTPCNVDISPLVNGGHVIYCINNGEKEIHTAINLLVNKAINLDDVNKEHVGLSKVEDLFSSTDLPLSEKITVIEIEK